MNDLPIGASLCVIDLLLEISQIRKDAQIAHWYRPRSPIDKYKYGPVCRYSDKYGARVSVFPTNYLRAVLHAGWY